MTEGEPRLAGQTVVVLGGSSGIGLETARLPAPREPAVILTARDPDRLHRVGLELGASIAAFDATDPVRLERFFRELPGPIDHVLVSGAGPYYAPFAELDFDEARRNVEAHLWVQLRVARLALGTVRPGGTLLFIGGTGGRRPSAGPLISTLTAGLPAMVKSLALELAPVRVNLLAPGFVDTPLSASILGDQLVAAPRAAPHDAPDRPCRRPGRRGGTRSSPDDEHGNHGRDLRHRRRAAARRSVSHERAGALFDPTLIRRTRHTIIPWTSASTAAL